MPFPPPPGIKLIRVDPKTGQRAGPDNPRAILEAFKPGTAPPDNGAAAVAMGSVQDGTVGAGGITPEADRAVRGGGVY
jgi:penicillin-binding protein 1A